VKGLESQIEAGARRDSAQDEFLHGEVAGLVQEVRGLTRVLMESRPGRPALVLQPSMPAAKNSVPEKAAAISAHSAPAGLELKGDLQLQAERQITAASGRDNLDDFWGRLNLGAEYQGEEIQSRINVRIFPEGFGFEPITGATFDTAGQGALKLQSQPSPRIVINHAWVRYAFGQTSVLAGRFETVETQSANYGNYVDLAPGGKFLGRPASHNAVEFTWAPKPFSTSVLLGTNDRKLNRGFLRVYQKAAFGRAFQAALGYRVNVFDRFKYDDAEILQRFDLNLQYAFASGFTAYGETALLQDAGKEDALPLMLGLQIPTQKVLDALALETEFLADRKIGGENKEWLFNFHAVKTFGKRLKLQGGLFSHLSDPEPAAFGLAVRATSKLK
jgi:hypothetical protein